MGTVTDRPRWARRRIPHLESLEDRSLLSGPTGSLGGYTYTTLNFPGGYETFASGINDRGQVVGSYVSYINQVVKQHGFLLSEGIYITIDFPGAAGTEATGINDSGVVVGDYYDASGDEHGFLDDNGSYTELLGFPGATSTVPLGINNSGQVVGAYFVGFNNEQGFLLSGGIYTTLHYPGPPPYPGAPPAVTIPMAINNSGQIVGVSSGGGFLLSGGIYTTINFLGEDNIPSPSFLTGINDTGQIAGVIANYNGNEQAFLLSGGNYTTLDVPGAISSYVAGINDYGQIVGYDTDNLGANYSFIASPETLSTTTTVRSGPSPSNYGQTVTFVRRWSTPTHTARPSRPAACSSTSITRSTARPSR